LVAVRVRTTEALRKMMPEFHELVLRILKKGNNKTTDRIPPARWRRRPGAGGRAAAGRRRESGTPWRGDKAGQTFEQALDKIKPAASVIISRLRGLADPPDEIEVEFGLTLNAEAGAFVAAAGAEANYTVTLTWKREQKARPGKKGQTARRRISHRPSMRW